MSDEIKKTVLNTLAEPITNSAKNITDKPTQNIGTTLADIWYLVFGGISQAAEKRKLKYSYALQEFEKELQEKISEIPKNKLIEPDLQIVAPALESAKYCIEKDELREMFANLISSSMNDDQKDYIHPIFTNIIKQLSKSEALYLKDLEHVNNRIDLGFSEIEIPKKSLLILESQGLIYVNLLDSLSVTHIQLSELGIAFCKACITPSQPIIPG